ncbi:MAG: acetyl-CoA carboxylase, biotin carboxyl carrier protein [Candidatus Eremiobacteraeota bacterium]|nr:acetyl-CoA carboxylase, biotin carboxyl carrier protein [Candidatus Eremiobacteraeota bacterium]MBV9737043.1 acetyl-CoA carboxylase, biotin carboxyl carrier protein [Candidatus Eremiobacteraeota bacterium]
MHEHDLDSLKVKLGDQIYELVRRSPTADAQVPPKSPPAAAAAETAATAPPPNVKRITAPLVGVFYTAPSPGADAFVKVGDRVTVGQVICIIEAMKLMNEITSDYAGVVTRIIPENGELVSLGEDMIWVETAP